jgi:hypothetical protein
LVRSRFGKAFGALFLAILVIFLIALAVTLVVSVISLPFGTAGVYLVALASSLLNAVMAPFVGFVLATLYLELRTRLEGPIDVAALRRNIERWDPAQT